MTSSRWLKMHEAAEYCGYARNTFFKIVRDYKIPRFGPKNNRFDRWLLDEWMRDPHCFLRKDEVIRARRCRKPGSFTPV